jgi:xeroderma pigmentosum group C-complementing protein
MSGADAVEAVAPPASVAVGGRRLPKGESDRFGIAREGCAKCGPDASPGVVILFYAYVHVTDPKALADRVRSACESAGVTGKIRIAAEGINGTAAGARSGIETVIDALRTETREPEIANAATHMDWKPQRGCAHAFDALSVRVVPEIVPFGDRSRRLMKSTPNEGRVRVASGTDEFDRASNAAPASVERLDPLAFHEEIARAAADPDSNVIVLDVRNWYESRVGYFRGAVRAPIRRFSQFPEWVESRVGRGAADADADSTRPAVSFAGKRVLMYCTGGIRCEKASSYLAAADEGARPRSIAQLRGGIAAYARDVAGIGGGFENENENENAKETTTTKTKTKTKSFFVGSNFDFDNRGAVEVTDDVCGSCDGCGIATDAISACASEGCHTLLLVCASCQISRKGGVRCCERCASQDVQPCENAHPWKRKKRQPCDCDGYASRERRLKTSLVSGGL